MGRGLIILLIVSLGLNLFAIGHLSGRWIGHEMPHQQDHRRSSGSDNPFRMLRHAEVLPEASREKFRTALKQGLPAVRENHEESRALRRELSALLSADDWDRDIVWAKMSEIQAQQALQRAAFDKAFLDALETLSDEERKLMMQAAQERRTERRERRERREHKRGFREDGE